MKIISRGNLKLEMEMKNLHLFGAFLFPCFVFVFYNVKVLYFNVVVVVAAMFITVCNFLPIKLLIVIIDNER